MICPRCGKQMKIGYVRGLYILWKCLLCDYGEIAISDKGGQGSQSNTKTKSSGEEKPPQSSHL